MTLDAGRRWLLATSAVAGAAMLLAAGPAAAQSRTYDIPAEPLSKALRDFGRISGRQIIFTEDLVRGRAAPPLKGAYSSEAALEALLRGSGLTSEVSPAGAIMIVSASGPKSQGPEAQADQGVGVAELVVTGTRIKGVAPSSPVLVLTQQSMVDAGQSNIGDVIRSIPQNFTGGQNPGVGLGGGGLNNQNLTGSSAIDLRGLGPDATLTLLNGRRLSYDAFTQAVDVSVIPLAAIDQVQVVTDGASAIYGSDAVAGVANIILKRDFEGVTATARYGGATEGGDIQNQYNVTTGKRWDTGGFIATYNYEHDTAIYADQRDYTSAMPARFNLLPAINAQSVLVSGHQDITPSIHFSLDGLYSNRQASQILTEPPVRVFYVTHSKEYFVSPTLTFDLPRSWTFTVNGLVGKEASDYAEPTYDLADNLLSPANGCYCNGVKQIEADAEGPLLRLPGGEARLALGAGYRINTFDNPSFTSSSDTTGDRKSFYAFGELNLPLVSPELAIPWIRSLTVNGAVRYESYNDIGDIATPKIGVIYSPFADLDFKASWGKSFKAPTLLQQHMQPYAELFPIAGFGGIGYPATATGLLIGGGNPDLKPERATTFTAGATLRPHQVEGLKLEANYFHIDYRDRVMEPIANLAEALANPAFSQFITYSPSAALQAQLLSNVSGFYNFVGAYDPSAVAAVVNDSFTNIARQSLHGIDLSADFTRPFAGGSLTFTGTATWLSGTEVIDPGTPAIPIAGVIYYPPHFRARGGVIWNRDDLTLSGYVNHQSGLTDNMVAPFVQIGSQTTVDVNGIYAFRSATGLLRDVTVSVAVQNLFDAAPPYAPPPIYYVPAFDTTNYSPVGRFVSVTVSKHW